MRAGSVFIFMIFLDSVSSESDKVKVLWYDLLIFLPSVPKTLGKLESSASGILNVSP